MASKPIKFQVSLNKISTKFGNFRNYSHQFNSSAFSKQSFEQPLVTSKEIINHLTIDKPSFHLPKQTLQQHDKGKKEIKFTGKFFKGIQKSYT